LLIQFTVQATYGAGIRLEFNATKAGEVIKVRVTSHDNKGGNDGADTTIGDANTKMSAADNAGTFVASQSAFDRIAYTVSLDPNDPTKTHVLITPTNQAAAGDKGEPMVDFVAGLSTHGYPVLSQLVSPSGNEIGFGTLTFQTGAASGGGTVSLGDSTFVASLNTTPDVSSSDIVALLSSQLLSHDVQVTETSNSLTVLSTQIIQVSESDPGFAVDYTTGTTSVPEPYSLILLGTGVLSTLGYSMCRKRIKIHGQRPWY